jgi:protein gp37
MSDFFHDDIPDDYLFNILDVIKQCPQHIFQILTKRAERMLRFSKNIDRFPDNIWMGVTVESNEYKKRIAHVCFKVKR